MSIEIRPTVVEDIPAVAKVLSEATVFKAEHDDYLWGTEPYSEAEVQDRLLAGGLYTVTDNGVIAGTVRITESDEGVWGDDGQTREALYVHGLATSNEARGKNIGGQILDWAMTKAREQGRKAVRLDCSYANRKLCDYYERRGFVEVKRTDLPRHSKARDMRDPVYQAALFQRDIVS